MTTAADDARNLTLSRELSAPRDLVWAALTTPEHLGRWWGPTGFRTETHGHDLRPGGMWHLTMHGPDGRAYPNHVVFDVVEPPERLVLRYVQESGQEAVHHVTTITLDALAPGRTRITLALRFPSAEACRDAVERYGAMEGGQQTLGRLAALLEGSSGDELPDATLVVRRVLAAPPELVWSVWTDADHLQRWFHPEVWTIFSAALDLRVGGSFHYGFRGPEMPETWGLWTFTEVDPPRRLRFDVSFADAARRLVPSPFGGAWPARVDTTVTLEPHAGLGRGTVLTLRSAPRGASAEEVEAFRAMLPSMDGGWGQTLEALGAYLRAVG
ncbi:MAG: SRPBCC domain-containing protein [Alphaproteobacteria bacterium]|nr:SRPBCC domain-containing protein [Alphaproteobacteria bacterium]